jgi:hypothetical protein
MSNPFPAVGRRYSVDFKEFKVELDFTSETSMTYYNLGERGERVSQETVAIAVEPIRNGIFLVTWTEADKTTVVHVEDYERNQIITNITDPKDGLLRFAGEMTEIS